MGAGLALLLAGPASAQDPVEDAAAALEEESPRVERVRFESGGALTRSELRVSIVTQETQCRAAILLKPFCMLTDWSTFIRKEYLDRRELPRDELRLEVLYFRRGYREASVRSEIVPAGKGVEVVFHIEEGPPTLVDALQVRQTETLLSDRQIRRAQLPAEGQPLDLIRLEAGLFELRERLRQEGYLDADLTDVIDVAEQERRASVEIEIDPGPRATLETLEIEGNEGVTDGVIQDAVRLRPGRILRSGDLVAGERSLYESNLFHEARLALPPQADSAKRLEIVVREAPPRSARVGGGFNTIEFVQVEARYTHYNWMGDGRRLDVVGALGNLFADQLNGKGVFLDVLPPSLPEEEAAPFLRPTWQVSGELMQPGFLAADNRVGLGLFAHRRSLPGIVVDDGFGASLSLTRRLDFRTPVSLEYRFESTAVDAGDLYFCAYFGVCDLLSIAVLRTRHTISPLGLAFRSDKSDDPLSPRSGHRLRLDLEHASALTLSDFRYNRITLDMAGYVPFGLLRRRVLSGRVRAGWVGPLGGTADALGIDAEGLALLHPRRRFFAGGARSVRGFGENQLGPRILTVNPDVLLGRAEGGGDASCTVEEVVDGSCDPNEFSIGAFTPRPLGGSAVLEGSVEYRLPFLGPLQGAVFLDGAIVGTGLGSIFSEGVGAVTPGVGVRYHSPVVPIRVDLGFRPRLHEVLPVLTEVSDLSGRRRLVRLTEPRIYDPVGESSRSFLGRAFAQLRLHVWIGEAY
jgi:outer membrane protein assembly factor BamA